MSNWLAAVLGVVGISLLSLIGAATLRLSEAAIKRLLPPTLAVAAGALLGDTFLHLMPETYARLHDRVSVGLLALLGVFCFFVLEHWLSAHGDHDHDHAHSHVEPLGPLSIVANTAHNFVDGALIGGAFLAGRGIGVATLIAIALHEIPHEASNYALLVQANFGRKRAVLVNLLVGLGAVLGTLVALGIGERASTAAFYLLPFTAGCFVYLACADLIPELLRQRKSGSPVGLLVFMFVGVGIMVGLVYLGG